LLGKSCTSWTMPPRLFCSSYFSVSCFCPGLSLDCLCCS
jgi:hypothetical protein